MSKSILIISPLLSATGNTSTVGRLREHFIKHGLNVELHCSLKLAQCKCSVIVLNNLIVEKGIDGILLVHAVKSGSCVLCSCDSGCKISVKYGVVFGGTDLNEDVRDPKKLEIMKRCMRNSEFSIAFTESLKAIANTHFGNICIHLQPQALDYGLYDACSTSIIQESAVNCNQGISNPFVFILPCSIRPVKDPIYLIDEFLKWKSRSEVDIRLLVIGPVTDADYGKLFFNKLNDSLGLHKTFDNLPEVLPSFPKILSNESPEDLNFWFRDPNGSPVQYVPAIRQEKFQEYLQSGQFFALVNTSKSEGMASSLLEAMASGIPVIARNIDGNRAVIDDMRNGLLFSTPEDFVLKATELINNQSLLQDIVTFAKSHVCQQHSPLNEANFYLSLVEKYF